jgi:hypothetical protein
MKALTSIITVLAVGTMFATAAEESKKAATGTKPETTGAPKAAEPAKPAEGAADPAADGTKKKGDPEASFKKLDADSDNAVTLEEMKAGPMGKKNPAKAEEMFKKKDKDADGKLTLEEYKSGKKKDK